MKQISIITPAYNAERFIEKTIESVLAQTYPAWELIVVDDCSKDQTVKIVESYCAKDERVRLIKHSTNRGVAAARNTAIKESKGQYIAFLDSDDMWLPEKLEKQLRFMEENNYVLTYTAYQKFYSDTGETGRIITVPSRMTYESIFYNTAIACLTVMVNKEKAGDFEMPQINHFEDQCTWQRILKRGWTAYGLNECLARYRVGAKSLTSNKAEAARRQWNVYRKFYGFSVVKSGFYFVSYALHALIKHL